MKRLKNIISRCYFIYIFLKSTQIKLKLKVLYGDFRELNLNILTSLSDNKCFGQVFSGDSHGVGQMDYRIKNKKTS